MKKYMRVFRLWLLMVLLLSSVAFGEEVFPTRQGMINDFANVISSNIEAEMDARSREVLKKTGTTIAVATVPTIGENYISDYVNRLYRAWGVGKKGVNKGILIFVAVKERKVRIETGYGVEGILPDGKVGEILRSEILPQFKKNDYGTGLLNGVNAISRVIAEDAKVNLDGKMLSAIPLHPPKKADIDGWEVGMYLGIFLGIFALMFFLATKFGGKSGSTGNNTDSTISSGSFSSPDSSNDSSSSGSDSSDSGGFDGGDSGGGGAESDY